MFIKSLILSLLTVYDLKTETLGHSALPVRTLWASQAEQQMPEVFEGVSKEY
jgi:hypothetical protein